MVFYTISLEGTDEDIQNMVAVISEVDENFEGDETDNEYDFMEDGNEELVRDDFEQMAINMAKAAPSAFFTMSGDEENHGELMAFEFIFKDGKLESKHSGWYVSYLCNSFNYDSYEVFCDSTGLEDKIDEEQFATYMEESAEIAVLESGNGNVVKRSEIPMTTSILDWKN